MFKYGFTEKLTSLHGSVSILMYCIHGITIRKKLEDFSKLKILYITKWQDLM